MSKSGHVFQEERERVHGLDWGTYSVRERVLTCLPSVCFMCVSEGVCQCMYMLGLDVVCVCVWGSAARRDCTDACKECAWECVDGCVGRGAFAFRGCCVCQVEAEAAC